MNKLRKEFDKMCELRQKEGLINSTYTAWLEDKIEDMQRAIEIYRCIPGNIESFLMI